MKTYSVQVEFEVIEFKVTAKDKRSAKKKALARISRMNPTRIIKKSYPGKGKELLIDEI